MAVIHQEVVDSFPVLQAHRGYHVHCAENTMESLQQAKTHGFKACEFDVRLSQDGVVVLHHDSSLMRIHHDQRAVSQTDWIELKRLGVTRLEDVLTSDDVPEFLNIEVKNESYGDFSLEKSILDLLNRLPHQHQILLSSFNPLSLMFFQHQLAPFPRALIVNRQREAGNPIYLREMWLDGLLETQFLHVDWQSLDRRLLLLNQARGRRVSVWTVNDETIANNNLQMGVASIISDDLMPEKINPHVGGVE